MVLVWRGLGFLVLFEVGIVIFGAESLGLGDPYKSLSVGVLSGALIWTTGRWLNNPARDRQVVDTQTGERFRLTSRHTLFWIPMEWWSIPVLLAGAAFAFFSR